MPTSPVMPGLPFEPVSYYYAGDYDPALLASVVKQAPELADFADENGNQQSAVYLSADSGGYWISVPNSVAESVVAAQVAQYPQADGQVQGDANAERWALVDSVRGSQLRQTDFLIKPVPVDIPTSTKDQIDTYEDDWLAFRQALRDITPDPATDPTGMSWPTLPPAPTVVITPPPSFADWDWPEFAPSP